MSDLKFADTHNLVAFLEKPTESAGFEEIVDFLNANPIKYALTVNPTVYCSCIKQLWDIVKAKTVNKEVQLQALVDKKKVIITESTTRRDLQLEDVEGTDCLPNATIFEQLTLMSAKTTAWNEFSSTMDSAIICLATNQKFNFSKYIFDSMVKNVDSMREGKGFSGRVTPLFPTMMVQAQEEIDEAANEEYVPTHSNDPLLSAHEILSLKLRDKRLEKKGGSRTHKLKTLFKGRKIDDIDKDAKVLVIETQGRYGDDLVFDTSVLDGEELFTGQDVVEKEVSTANPVTIAGEVVTTAIVEVSAATTTTTTTAITKVDLTLAQALAELRSEKPKVVVQGLVQSTNTTTPSTIPKDKSITFRDPGEYTTRTTLTPIPSNIKDKSKAKMIEPEKPLKKKEQIRLDEELAFKLQAKVEKQARLARKKAEKVKEANISWDNVQAMIEADRLLAERLQAREQEELTDEAKERLFVELLEKRKKHFAALSAQEKKNTPLTKAQKKSTMSTYLKHMAGFKQSQLKNKSFTKIQKLFDKAMTRVNMFVDMDTELVKESSKKAEAKMAQESSSKRAGEELEQEIVQDDEVAIDALPLATKPAPIVNFQIYRKGRNGIYQIIRADGSSKRYSAIIHMLRSFDREDLETLWKIVKARHGYTRLEEGYERVLWGDLKTMFEHHVEDLVWRVNAAGTKLQLLKDYNCLRIKTAEKIKIDWRSRILTSILLGSIRKIDDIDKDAEDVVEKEVSTANPVTTAGEVVTTASVEVSAATTTTTTVITKVDLTLAQALAELRSAKPKVVVQEPVQSTTTTTPSTIPKAKSIIDPGESTTRTTLTPIPSNIKDKGKGKMIESEKPLKKKQQIRLDEELALKLQAEEDEQARLAREKAGKVEEANISWDNVQAMIEADRLLAERLQAREKEELTDEEKARLFVELLEKRKKHFAALRAQEKRNKTPTKAQKKSIMSTYLKHMAGYKQSQLKNKSFAEIQNLFDKAMTRVNMFVDMDTELVKESSKKAEAEMAQESSSKRAGDELLQEVAKKQKMDDDKEKAKLQKLMEVVSNEEGIAIDDIPLATKPPRIVDYKIIKEGKISIYQIIRADESLKRYLAVIYMLKRFYREDLETLWKIVKARHGYTRPEEGYERVLWGDLKTMFEHQVEDLVWRVNAAGTKLQLLKDYNCSRIKTAEKIKIDWRSRILT
ncbi:hypothetical protein Tco_1146060 [Tanacetum coccineum]